MDCVAWRRGSRRDMFTAGCESVKWILDNNNNNSAKGEVVEEGNICDKLMDKNMSELIKNFKANKYSDRW